MRLIHHFSAETLTNAYVLGPAGGGDAIVIDPGVFDTELLAKIEDAGFTIRAVAVTRTSDAYIKGLRTLLRVYDAVVYAPVDTLGDMPARVPADGGTIPVDGIRLEVIGVPGALEPGLVYYTDRILFCGSILGAGTASIEGSGRGRLIFLHMLQDRVFSLPPCTLMFPSVGPPTTIGVELECNEALSDPLSARPHVHRR